MNLNFFKSLTFLIIFLGGFFIFTNFARAEDIIWDNSQIRIIDGTFTLDGWNRLIIEPGTVIKLTENSTIVSYGDIVAVGDADNPIVFTSIKDDRAGDDTNGDGDITSPAMGDWGHFLIQGEGAQIIFDYVEIHYGGGNRKRPTSFISVSSSGEPQIVLKEIKITHSSIINNFGSISFYGDAIFSISESNLYNEDNCPLPSDWDPRWLRCDGLSLSKAGEQIIEAPYVYWGHLEGPTTIEDYQNGVKKGTRAYYNINYIPYLIEPWPSELIGPVEPEIDPLILKYEPILYLHPNETYQPMNVEAFVNHSALWDSHGAAPDELLKPESNLDPVTLENLNLESIDSSSYYLQFSQDLIDKIPDADKARTEYQEIKGNDEVKYTYYARKMIDAVEETGKEYIVLQYWFFYAMSDFGAHVELGNIHEGDWECVMIFLDRDTEEPKYVAHSIHHYAGEKGFPGFQYTSVRNKWDSIEISKEDDHIFSFVGLGSHANYPNNGNNGVHPVPVFSDDQTSADGLRFDNNTWGNIFVFEEGNFPGWLTEYRGTWGVYNNEPGGSGSNSPFYEPFYNKFNEPIKWAGVDKVGELKVLAEGQYAFNFAKQFAKIIFNRAVNTGTVFVVDLHDGIVQIGENLKNIAFLPHFWDITSNLINETFQAEVSFEYDQEELETLGISEDHLAIFYYDEGGSIWQKLPSVVDKANNIISFFTAHFSRYSLGAEIWQDISEDIKVIEGLRHYNNRTNIQSINVRIKNNSLENITGDLRLIIKNTDKEGVVLINNTGTTTDGLPFIEVQSPYNDCIFIGSEEDIPESLNKRGLLSRAVKRKMIQKKPLGKLACELIINKYPELEEKLEYALLPHNFTEPITLEFSLPVKKTQTIKLFNKEITIYIPEFRKFDFEVEIMNRVVEWN
ncbi:MAG: hypothetical protein ABIG60_00630 [Patescibacteria group bacterium]